VKPARWITQSNATVGDLTERDLIDRIHNRLPPRPPWMLVGIGDDAAVVEPARNRVDVITVDALVEGVHFDRAFTPPGAIGHRALAANLSDLAAMGAAPRLALLSLALPSALPAEDFDAIGGGIVALAARHALHIAGGNLTRSPGPLVIDITVVGTVKRRQFLVRGGARAGDDIYVSGTIGGAAAGLQMLKAGAGAREAVSPACIERYLRPEPRVRLGIQLARNRAAVACMDLSDGLADAVRQVAVASGVGAVIDANALPIDAGARAWFEARGADAVAEAISGGDDYELLAGARPRMQRRLIAASRAGGTPLTRIGTFTGDLALVIRRTTGDAALPQGYGHFR
jgi:thiamine-monophosphate kinase